MKVRELKNFLELQLDEARAGMQLKGISHWMAALFKAGDYEIGNPKDVLPLQKLEAIGIVALEVKGGRQVARLTKSGKELYQDFYAHGYYL